MNRTHQKQKSYFICVFVCLCIYFSDFGHHLAQFLAIFTPTVRQALNEGTGYTQLDLSRTLLRISSGFQSKQVTMKGVLEVTRREAIVISKAALETFSV